MDAALWRRLVPSAERIEIPEAGHLLPYERPDPFVAAVVGFLARG